MINNKDAGISKKEKSELLLKYSINTLAHWLKAEKHIIDCYNPIIMLKRNYTVPKEDTIAFHHLEVEHGGIYSPAD